MSQRHVILISLIVSVCTWFVMTGLAAGLIAASGTAAPSAPSGAVTELLANAKQAVQQVASPAVAPAAALQFCRSDADKFCPQKKGAELSECLQDHFDEVSAACHTFLQKSRDNLTACKDEIGKYCATAGYGGGRMVNCLKEHMSKLSSACAKIIGVK